MRGDYIYFFYIKIDLFEYDKIFYVFKKKKERKFD